MHHHIQLKITITDSVLFFADLYLHAKTESNLSVSSENSTDHYRIFLHITWETEFSKAWVLCRKIAKH